MSRPLVSVLLPNLNNVRYLPERLETIYSQTCRDWELIIVDNYSDDGAWELFQQHAQRDSRIRLSQAPRAGMYANWNNCLEKARGDYIYIATSDDTMKPECLAELKAALDRNPSAGLAQCGLEIIDADGVISPGGRSWDYFTLASYKKDLILRPSLRVAPHDGLLHTALFTICTSITQLLIKREVFERLGNFDTNWGSVGDFEWQMRVALVYNCAFIPARLASWRIHPEQATGKMSDLETCRRHLQMAKAAIQKVNSLIPGHLDGVRLAKFLRFLELDVVEYEFRDRTTRYKKLGYAASSLLNHPVEFFDWLQLWVRGISWELNFTQERRRRLENALRLSNTPHPIFLDR